MKYEVYDLPFYRLALVYLSIQFHMVICPGLNSTIYYESVKTRDVLPQDERQISWDKFHILKVLTNLNSELLLCRKPDVIRPELQAAGFRTKELKRLPDVLLA